MLLILIMTSLLSIPLVATGCEQELKKSASPSTSELSKTMVPNVPLDLYIYAKQNSPTVIPAELVNSSHDVTVESLAIWGVPINETFAFGAALTLPTNREASRVYDEIQPPRNTWTKLSENVIYLVYGTDPAAESLRKAISNNDFKHYDDSEGLHTVSLLPSGDTTKLAAVAIAKPSDALVNTMVREGGFQARELISLMLKLVDLKIVSAGLYSPHEIDVAKTFEALNKSGSPYSPDLGGLVLIKSGLPSLIVEPTVKKVLSEREFVETNSGELTVYKGSWNTGSGKIVHAVVRIEGNYIFVASSGNESYAETLIARVRVK
jgi:hypothetical protein